jgi:hypothetical protein
MGPEFGAELVFTTPLRIPILTKVSEHKSPANRRVVKTSLTLLPPIRKPFLQTALA